MFFCFVLITEFTKFNGFLTPSKQKHFQVYWKFTESHGPRNFSPQGWKTLGKSSSYFLDMGIIIPLIFIQESSPSF